MKKQYEDVSKEYQSKIAILSKLQQERDELARKKGNLEQLLQLNTQIVQIENEIKALKTQYGAQLKEFEQLTESNNALLAKQAQLKQKIEEHKKTTTEYDSFFERIESILARHSDFLGQRIDTDQMVVKQIPGTELANVNLDKVMQAQNAAAFDEVLAKLHNLNATDAKGMTLLMHCLKHGFWHGVEKLLSLGADVNVVDNNGCNALIYACAMPHIKYIKAIAEKTSNINLKTPAANGKTALHLAIAEANKFAFASEIRTEFGGKLEPGTNLVIDEDFTISQNWVGGNITFNKPVTLTIGADVTIGSSVGSSSQLTNPTNTTTKLLQICEFLISKGADINAQDNSGLTPLTLSCALKAKGLVSLLLEQPNIDLAVVDSSGNNVLNWALELRDKSILDKLLNKGLPINAVDNTGKTCFFWAVQYGWPDMIEFLAQKGANVNIPNNEGVTPLYLAILKSDAQLVSKLLELKADPNIARTNGFFPIHGAAHVGSSEIIEILLAKGVEIDKKSTLGHTALNYYCMLKDSKPEFVEFLIKKGAQINSGDNQGITPLYQAILACNLPLVTKLLELKADPNIARTNGFFPIHGAAHIESVAIIEKLVAQGVDIDKRSASGHTALGYYCALKDSKPEFADFLIKKGAQVNSIDNQGITPLYQAILTGNLPLVTKLLELNADPNIARTNGFFPIHGAAHVGSIEIIEKLIAKGIEIDKKSASGHTALNYYCGLPESKPEFADLLLKKGANINSQNSVNVTPFYSACMAGNVQMVKFLHDSGANIDLLNANGFHAIHGAIHYGKIDVVDELVKIGVPIDKMSSNGYTSLQYYCELNAAKISVVEFLIGKGASISCSINGKGLLHSAAIGKNIPILKLLITKGLSVNDLDQNGKTPLMLLLEDSNISKASKLEIFEQFSAKIDKTVKNKEGKNILDYLKTYCPEATKFFESNGADTAVELLQSGIDNIATSYDMENSSGVNLSGDQDSNDH